MFDFESSRDKRYLSSLGWEFKPLEALFNYQQTPKEKLSPECN